MSAPNQVIVTNNTGAVWTAAMFLHSAGSPDTSSFGAGSAYGATGVIGQGGTFGGSVQVDMMGRDFWMVAIVFGDFPQTCFVITGGANVEPYKECRAPENGSTSIVVSPSTDDGYTYPASITTYYGPPDARGAEDSECTATMANFAVVQNGFDPNNTMLNALSTYLTNLLNPT